MADMWDKATGWEYDALRLLPLDDAHRVWSRARDQAFPRVYLDWRVVSSLLLMGLLGLAHLIVIWLVVAWMGLGPFWRFLLELIAMPPFVRHVLVPYMQLVFLPRIRPYVRDELFRLIQQDLPPGHPLLQLDEAMNHRSTA